MTTPTDLAAWRKGYTANVEIERAYNQWNGESSFAKRAAFTHVTDNLCRLLVDAPPANVRSVEDITAALTKAADYSGHQREGFAKLRELLNLPTEPEPVPVRVGDIIRFATRPSKDRYVVLQRSGYSVRRIDAWPYGRNGFSFDRGDLEVLRDGEWLPVNGYTGEAAP